MFENVSFRENQLEIINATMSGHDVLALIPTGGGKSLTFQLPASIEDGVTVVIMPLVSLIEDNFSYTKQVGLPAAVLTNEKSMRAMTQSILNGETKLIYMTPEKFERSEDVTKMLQTLYKQNYIKRFVIDEVHCVS